MASCDPITHIHTTEKGKRIPIICTCDNRRPKDVIPFIDYACRYFIDGIDWVHHHKGHLRIGFNVDAVTIGQLERVADMYPYCEGGSAFIAFNSRKYPAPFDGTYYDNHYAEFSR